MAARRPRTKWRPEDDQTLVKELLDCKANGLQADSGWKSTAWTQCAEALEGSELLSGGAVKTADTCQTRWQRLKGDFILVKKMRGQSGFGWDDVTKTPTATPEVWEPFLVSNPKAKDLFNKPFPLYDDLLNLVDGIVATGNFVFRAGQGNHPAGGTDPASSEGPATSTTGAGVQGESASSPSAGNSPEPELPGHGEDSVDARRSVSEDPATPQKKANDKRAASPSLEPTTPSPSQRKKGRLSGADALLRVSRAIHSVSDALVFPVHGLTTPQRRAKAIKIVEEEEDMSDHEIVQVAKMFRVQPDIADTYVALQSKTTRSHYVRSELEDFLVK